MKLVDAISVCEDWFAYIERQRERSVELQRLALRFYAEARDFYLFDKDGNYIDNASTVARRALLMARESV